jgi:cysteine desulfurase
VPVDESGLVEPDRLLDQVDDETFLVSVIHGNNEIGTLQPLDELARAVKSRFPCCLFHTDAVQSFGHVPLSLAGSGIDLLSLSAHKLHGPKGVGALVVQESDRRAGTLNVPGIVGMTAAARFMGEHLDSHARHLESVVGALRTRLEAELPDLRFNGHPSRRLPGLLSVSVPGVKSQNLMLFLEAEGVIVSAGAACKSTSSKQSHVLEAIGQRPDHATIRLSASFETTLDEAQAAADRLVATVRRLRK